MSRWFRHYTGLCSDPKFGGIARRAKVSRERAVFIFAFALECAAERNSGGAFSWDADSVADLLNCETIEVERVFLELEAAGMVDGCKIAKWSTRQFEVDRDATAAERQARFRAKHRAATADEGVSNGPVTRDMPVSHGPHRQIQITETEKIEGESALAGPLPPKPSVSGSKKGSRVPTDFRPNPVDLAEANRLIGTRVEIEILKFRDYWGARAGKDGLKLDWDATWRNWARRASEAPMRPGAGHPAARAYKSPVVDRLAGLVWVEEGSPDWLAWKRTRPGYVASQLQERSENGKALVGAYLPSSRPEMQGAAA